MLKDQLLNLLPDQSNDLFWVIDADLRLIYANKSYLNLINAISGVEQKLNAPEGTNLEIEEHFYHGASNVIQYSQISFKRVTGDDEKLFTVACQSRDITGTVKNRSEAKQMINASLNVFCTVNDRYNRC
ncbi:MAG: hypothetical protein ABIN94_00215 [Ferruginibacter sp.]